MSNSHRVDSTKGMPMTLHNAGVGLISMVTWFSAGQLDESTLVPIGGALAVGMGVWYLASRLQSQDDALKNIKEQINRLPCSSCDNYKAKR